jgi:thiosulfate dehydrogenase
MFRGFILGIIFTVLAAAAVGYYALSSGLIPASADTKPGQIERFIAEKSLQATLNKDAPKNPNPVQLTDENLVKGIRLYETNCAICHGTAEGDTSAAIRYRRRRGRSGGRDVLENKARHPLDRHARLEG